VQNTGTKTWTAGNYWLGFTRNNLTWGLNRVPLPANIAPGPRVTFQFMVAAPKSAGTDNFQWQMLKGQAGWFGSQTSNVKILVTR
jgi:hypothetical protein